MVSLPQLEEVQGFCDPNPTEYVDTDKNEPNVVFYWGLQDGKNNVANEIELIEEEFMGNINFCYDISPGRMELSTVQASELPKNAQFDDEKAKGTKTCWKKIADCDEKRSAPTHSPADCAASNGGQAECLDSWG